MGAWWGLGAGLALIGLGYVGDQVVGAAFDQAARTFSNQWAIALDAITRLVAVALMAGLGALVFRGPRQRRIGALMLAIGLYFSLIQAMNWTVLANTGISLPPGLVAYQYPTHLLLWSGTAVAVLGFIELVWPTDMAARP